MYLLGVVYLVGRQLEKVEEVDSVLMTDKSGKTIIKAVDNLMDDDKEVLLWLEYVSHDSAINIILIIDFG